jgi:hypothetical protein
VQQGVLKLAQAKMKLYLKNNQSKKGWGIDSSDGVLLSKSENLNSTPVPTKPTPKILTALS